MVNLVRTPNRGIKLPIESLHAMLRDVEDKFWSKESGKKIEVEEQKTDGEKKKVVNEGKAKKTQGIETRSIAGPNTSKTVSMGQNGPFFRFSDRK